MASIQRKIVYGYAATSGVALVGAILGLGIGNYYQQQALFSRQLASQESHLLSRLQLDVLYNRPAKQLSPHVQDPNKFRQESDALLNRLQRIHGRLEAHNSSAQPATLSGLQTFLDEYEGVVAAFQTRTEAFAEIVQPLTANPEGAIEAQQQIVELVKSPEFVAFIEAPDEMAVLYESAIEREGETETALSAAEQLRTRIILSSLALSIALGIMLSLYISRAIARPIDAVSAVAQQVTRDGNFALRADIQSQDAVGVLAQSLNQLIARVQQLLLEQQEYVQQLESAREAANAASQAKSDFLANMSHELRTPLNGILGYAQILNNASTFPQKHRRGIEVIHHCGNHLLGLINDVLDLAKIEACKLELIPAPLQLPSLVQDVAEICRLQAEAKGIEFSYSIEDELLPDIVIVDEKRLRQVLINLLSNAIKFTDQGQVSLRVEPVSAVCQNQCAVRFHVEDTGIGISAADLERLFRAFEQVGDRQNRAAGTGLGLAISHRIVNLMGGQLQVSSELGAGSHFYFEVDLHVLEEIETKRASETPQRLVGYEGDRRCILLIDDHWENRSVLLSVLEPLGFEIIEAEDGREGLAKLREHTPDLVITDLAMPEMDGFKMLKQLFSIPAFTDQPVIISSASVAWEDQCKALEIGGGLFLPKPVDVKLLLSQVAELLDLAWQYEALPEQQQEDAGELADAVLLPDMVDLRSLLQLAQRGRAHRLKQQLLELTQADPKLRKFAQSISQLLEAFQVEQAEEKLNQYISQAEDLAGQA